MTKVPPGDWVFAGEQTDHTMSFERRPDSKHTIYLDRQPKAK